MPLEFVLPSIEHKDVVWKFKKEWQELCPNEQMYGANFLNRYDEYEKWLHEVTILNLDEKDCAKKGKVPNKTFLIMNNSTLVGMVNLRLKKPYLVNKGHGHIGVCIAPSHRGKGNYLPVMQMAMNYLFNYGLDVVLVA